MVNIAKDISRYLLAEAEVFTDAPILAVLILMVGAIIAYLAARWRYAGQIDVLKTQVGSHKDEIERLKNEISRLRNDQHRMSTPSESAIRLHSIRAQVAQVIDGTKLIEKWHIRPSDLLNMVRDRLLDAYAPDVEDILNKTETDLERSLGFYSEDNETDEDTVARFRFTPRDISRVEIIAENYQTAT